MFDTLEHRRLLSVSAAFIGATGVLEVIGTDKPEVIEVNVEYTKVRFTEPSWDQPVDPVTATSKQANLMIDSAIVTLSENGLPVRRWTLPLSSFKEVHLSGAGGDDTLTFSNYATPIYGSVMGGDGNDLIEVINSMGGRGAEVMAGAGDDTIYLIATKGAIAGHVAYGEAGNDLIFGSMNIDYIWGDDPGLAEVVLPQGDDSIYAGGGNDRVWGGGGNDILCGEDGDDWLCGDAGADYVDGDDGYDWAFADPEDKFDRVEEMLYATWS